MQTDNKYPFLERYMNLLAICHTIIADKSKEDGSLIYNASSPDELALTNAARYFGVVFMERDEDNNIVIFNKNSDKYYKYKLLNVIEFTSARKRMSVIVKDEETSKIMVLTKGADSIIIPRLKSGQEELISKTNRFLNEYANEGLRTLLVAEKEVSQSEYEAWNAQYSTALCQITGREEAVGKVAEKIEKDFTLLGSTAIEDKLQDEVAEVIRDIRSANIKLWVLTVTKLKRPSTLASAVSFWTQRWRSSSSTRTPPPPSTGRSASSTAKSSRSGSRETSPWSWEASSCSRSPRRTRTGSSSRSS